MFIYKSIRLKEKKTDKFARLSVLLIPVYFRHNQLCQLQTRSPPQGSPLSYG